jgi:folate-binding protein YgfZ
MSIDWQPVIQAFSGQLSDYPSHLTPTVTFEKTHSLENLLIKPSICPLTNIGFLSVKGPDAAKYLQGQLTCDLKAITQNTIKLSGHCNPKGRLHGIFQVIQLNPDEYCLAMPNTQLEHVQASLKKYAIFSKVKIEIHNFFCFGLAGNKTAIEKIDPALSTMSIDHKLDIADVRLTASYIRLPCHDANLYRFMVVLRYADEIPAEKIIAYWQNLNHLAFVNVSTVEWHKFNILALLPTIYPDTTEKCLVHSLNLPKLGAVSFKKGCYTGQEIVARMEYLGNLKKTICCREFQLPNLEIPILGQSLPEDKADHILLDFVPVSDSESGSATDKAYLGLFITDI